MRSRWPAVMAMSCSFVSPVHAADAGAEGRVLEEVVVTATLRELSLQDTPLSVGVLTGDQLRDIGAISIDDVWRQIPNLAVRDAPFGGHNFVIRGLVDTDSFLSTESINAFYVDDTPITYVSALFSSPGDVALLDLARVEVLRGPQGTLVGANAMGGAVRFITNEPDPDASNIHVDANLSQTHHGGWNFGGNAVLNQPTGANSALRFAALYNDDDGFIDDIGLGRDDINSEQRTAGRLSWLWNISDRWDLLTRVYAESIEVDGYNYADDVGRPSSGILTDGDYQVVLSNPERREEDLSIASVRVRWHGEQVSFHSATSFFDKDLFQSLDWSVEQEFIFGLQHPAAGFNDSTQEDFTQELRLNSTGEQRFGWLVGAYYLDQTYELDEWLSTEGIPEEFFGFPAGSDLVYVDSRTRSTREELALFGEVSRMFTDRLEGVIGLRWFDYERQQTTGEGGLFITPGSAEGGANGISAKASLSWDLTEQTKVYGLIAEGFRPGQFNNPSAINLCDARPLIDDDSLVNYELGAKFRSSDGRLQFNGALFQIDWDDMQINAFGTCGFPNLDNVGAATSQGLEADFSWLLSDAVNLQGGVGYTDAKLDTGFVNDDANVPAGTRIPNVPKWTANLAATWQFAWTDALPGHFRADAQYVDERTVLFDPESFPTYERIDSYALANLRLGVRSGNFTAELFVNNIFDKRAELFCCRNFFDPAVNRPRTIGLRWGWRTD